MHLRVKPLLRRELDIEGVALRGGRVKIPIWGTNDQPRELMKQRPASGTDGLVTLGVARERLAGSAACEHSHTRIAEPSLDL